MRLELLYNSFLYVFVVPEHFIGKVFSYDGFWGSRMWF